MLVFRIECEFAGSKAARLGLSARSGCSPLASQRNVLPPDGERRDREIVFSSRRPSGERSTWRLNGSVVALLERSEQASYRFSPGGCQPV